MFVRRYGSGNRWVLGIPGWGEDHRCYAPLAPHIPASFSLAAVDPPGYGLSQSPKHLDAATISAELRATFENLAADNSRPEAVVGNCSGGVLAAELLRVTSLKPQRLVLIDPFAFVPGYFKLFLRGDFGRMAYRITFASSLGRFITNMLLRSRRKRDTDLMSAFREVDHEVNYRYLEVLDSFNSIERFRSLSLPVAIIAGERTFAAVRRSLDLWRQIWPEADLHRLAGVGHLPIREAPDKVAQLLFPPDHGVSCP